MSSTRSMFMLGLTLGVALGVGGGWFVFRTPSAPSTHMAKAAPASSVVNAGTPFEYSLGDRSASLPNWDLDHEGVEHSDSYHPSESPLQNAVALDQSNEDPARPAASETPPARQVKEPMPIVVAEASPIAYEEQPENETLRGLIDIELADLPEHQRQVWYEALKGVENNDVAGILRMWKLLGGPPTQDGSALFDPPPRQGELRPLPSTPAPLLQTLNHRSPWQQAIRIHLRNTEMANTLGYRRRIPSFEEREENGTWTVTRVVEMIDWDAVQLKATRFPFDLAVQGTGFFTLKDPQGETVYARTGRFSLDEQRRLSLLIGETRYLMHPEVIVPEGSDRLTIHPDGFVELTEPASRTEPLTLRISLATPFSENHLEPIGNGLFQAAMDKTGATFTIPESQPDSSGAGTILQGALEFPRIDIEAEMNAVKGMERRLNESEAGGAFNLQLVPID